MPITKANFSIALDDILPPTKEKSKDTSGFRALYMKSGVFAGMRGSAYVEMGNTRVLCQINGPKESGDGDYHTGTIAVEITGCDEEKLKAQLGSALSGAVQLRKYNKSVIYVDITVLHSDGGVLQAALICSSLALMHAGIELYDIVLAAHTSIDASGNFQLDPANKQEPNQLDVTIGLMPNLNQVICCEVQGTLPYSKVKESISRTHQNCLHLYPHVRETIADSIC